MAISVTGLDHLVIRVRDLDKAEALFRSLGFTLTPRGFHAGRGSANHTAPLSGGNYFELIYLPANSGPTPFGSRPEGPVALALATSDSRKIHDELAASGFPAEPPQDLERPVELSDGVHQARFLNQRFPTIATEALNLFTCQHLTRDLVWRPEWEGHANGAVRLTEALIVHSAPDSLQPVYARLFGAQRIRAGDDGFTIGLGDDRISFLSPRAFAARFPDVAAPADVATGWFAGASFRTRSLSDAAKALRSAGIVASRSVSGSLVAPPGAAAETLLEFHSA